jgi:hypothetical protein
VSYNEITGSSFIFLSAYCVGESVADALNEQLPISSINLSGNKLHPEVREKIITSWNNTHFDCTAQNSASTFVLYGEPNSTAWL